MPRKRLTRSLVRNWARVVLELVLLSCGPDLVARWSAGVLLVVSGCWLDGDEVACERG
jgi:hypothetical protein